ncbi:MAG: hypothetical protein AAF664_05220 [Planctomycetota bacterium]
MRRLVWRRLGTWLCCSLGMVFALGPITHGLFHAGGLAHRHPSGAHGHSHGHGAVESGISHGEHSHGHRHPSHEISSVGRQTGHALRSRQVDVDSPKKERTTTGIARGGEAAEIPNPPVPDQPPSNDGCLFVLLELDATDSIALEVGLVRVEAPWVYVRPQWNCVVHELDVGSVSPRGPPSNPLWI